MKSDRPDINFLIPLYNEEEVFHTLIDRVDKVIDGLDLKVEVILVNDGSTDDTSELLESLAKKNPRYTAVFLSRNFGHQKALSAGLDHVNARKAVFILDADLQDPPELFSDFYAEFKKGYDVIYAIRKERQEGFFKKMLYRLYYLLLSKVSAIYIPINSGDFSLISRRVSDQLVLMKEESRFLRGMRSWVGFKQKGLEYKRSGREAGKTKYSFRRLYKLAMDGFFNFSELPVKAITYLGVFTVFISGIYLIDTLIKRFYFDIVPQGFTALLMTIMLFGGVQLISIGVLGEYIVRIFFEVKNRPLYIVDHVIRKGHEVEGQSK